MVYPGVTAIEVTRDTALLTAGFPITFRIEKETVIL